MAKPMEGRTPEQKTFLNAIAKMAFGGDGDVEAHVEGDTCVRCHGPATEFSDSLSLREYAISGLCQSCQDFVFVEPSE